jgi:(heptosyl)LPS beta-1,4-glucosyltransferase
MRLGCFVIHGNAVDTLGACLDDLVAVGDEVVAVDSGATDGSADLVRQRGVRAVAVPWQGYGAARAAAVAALKGCDFVFFLDADERLREGGRGVIRAWKESGPAHRYYRMRRYDWADLPSGRFLFRVEWRKRLVRREAAIWAPAMLVHEALPASPDTGQVEAIIDHSFARSLESRTEKDERYALLWAVQAYCAGRRAPANPFTAPVHWVRNALLKGALLRGGRDAASLSWSVARYHGRKRELLREIERGAHGDLVADYRNGEYQKLFARLVSPPTR